MKRIIFTLAIMVGFATLASANTGSIAANAGNAVAGLSIVAGGLVGRRAMQAIEAVANEDLSNYDGYEGDDYEGDDDYDGEGDDFLNFSGDAVNFKHEAGRGRNVSFTFTNSSEAADRTFFFNPSFKEYKPDDSIGDGVATDGAFRAIGVASNQTADVTCVGDECRLAELRRFVKHNPIRVTGFKISATGANATACVDEMRVTIEEASIFNSLGNTVITPSMYKSEGTFQNNIITVPRGFDLNDQCSVKLNVKRNSSVTITLILGGSVNSAVALARKAKRALKK